MRIVVNCGTWIAYKSANGVCYLYRKLMPQKQQPERVPHETQKLGGAQIIDMTDYTPASIQQFVPDDAAYVLITREEYDRMKSGLIV